MVLISDSPSRKNRLFQVTLAALPESAFFSGVAVFFVRRLALLETMAGIGLRARDA
jgi:hypothetical protein